MTSFTFEPSGPFSPMHGLPAPLDDPTWTRISEVRRPYRMWATVLLHMAWRRSQASTPSYRPSSNR